MVPLHEANALLLNALVKFLLNLYQCSFGTMPLAIAINEVALASEANKS